MGAHVRLAPSDASRGQSESTGVILIVLVAFILGSLVAAFAFTTFDDTRNSAPTVAFSYDYQPADERLTILVESESGGVEDGSGFDGSIVKFVCQSGDCDDVDGKLWESGSGPDGSVVAGDSRTLDIGPDAVVLIRWEEPRERGESIILGVWRGPEA
jgi:FlaG/FlaF family flagellin (archaellin)